MDRFQRVVPELACRPHHAIGNGEDAARLNASGLVDQIPLVAEDFSQWVIEDRFDRRSPGTAGGGRSVQ